MMHFSNESSTIYRILLIKVMLANEWVPINVGSSYKFAGSKYPGIVVEITNYNESSKYVNTIPWITNFLTKTI